MRLFVGIEISPAVVSAATELIAELRAASAKLAPRSRIAWVTAERLHITVRFIGHVDEARADKIRAVLAPPLTLDPFDLTIAGVSTFPPKGLPRVVWAGLTGGSAELSEIESTVSERLVRAGVPREQRPYNPHLTLARVRDAAGLRPASFAGGFGEIGLGSTSVDAITLFESRLSPKGPTYAALARTLLVGTERRSGGA
jgi:RNA 2',3'-cyclic 3'-phosphodiesterase